MVSGRRPGITNPSPLFSIAWSAWRYHSTGRAAVVSVELKPGRVVLFGLRPQHRGQTHATFPLLFNALYFTPDGASSASN